MDQRRTTGNETKTRILAVASHLFAGKGRDGVGIREIAREADVALNTVMYHFGSKENLYRQAVYYAAEQGIPFNAIFERHAGIDFSDKQQVADGLKGILASLFTEAARPEFRDHTDLMVQGVFGADGELLQSLLSGFRTQEAEIRAFLAKGGCTISEDELDFWFPVMWSQLLYYVSGREMVLLDNGTESLSEDFYGQIATRLAAILCAQAGLPAPA